ncbi:MAG: PP0621 family protein [Burkholderiaceae bacterium]
MRVLLILALLFCAFFVLRGLYLHYLRSSRNGATHCTQKVDTAEAETMVCCRECGAYFPVSEAISGPSGAVFCSDEHRRRHSPPH